jgi:hypothetical protein
MPQQPNPDHLLSTQADPKKHLRLTGPLSGAPAMWWCSGRTGRGGEGQQQQQQKQQQWKHSSQNHHTGWPHEASTADKPSTWCICQVVVLRAYKEGAACLGGGWVGGWKAPKAAAAANQGAAAVALPAAAQASETYKRILVPCTWATLVRPRKRPQLTRPEMNQVAGALNWVEPPPPPTHTHTHLC